MTTIRCKMICHHVAYNQYNEGMSNVRFGAVYSEDTGKPDDENAIFGKLTPFGEFNLSMVNEVAEKLEIGKPYYVDINPAD